MPIVFGIGVAAIGVWALVSPNGFYDTVAEYPPYNEHFLHDIGAFNLGLGSALLLAGRLGARSSELCGWLFKSATQHAADA